jgi:bacteriocin-like protein
MTGDFIILSNAELDQVSGGGNPQPMARHGWFVPQAPVSAVTLFSNPAFYRGGASTVKAF